MVIFISRFDRIDIHIEVRQFCPLDETGLSLKRLAMQQLQRSARLPPHAQAGAHYRQPGGC
jgi:hypothetical protein